MNGTGLEEMKRKPRTRSVSLTLSENGVIEDLEEVYMITYIRIVCNQLSYWGLLKPNKS